MRKIIKYLDGLGFTGITDPIKFFNELIKAKLSVGSPIAASLDFKNPQVDDSGFYYDVVENFEGMMYNYDVYFELRGHVFVNKADFGFFIYPYPSPDHYKLPVWRF